MRSIETGRLTLDSGTRVAVTTTVDSSPAGTTGAEGDSSVCPNARAQLNISAAPVSSELRGHKAVHGGMIGNCLPRAPPLQSRRLQYGIIMIDNCNRVSCERGHARIVHTRFGCMV